jgi:hypothetical protein
MINNFIHRIARLLLPQPVRVAKDRLYLRWHKWWLWIFPVNPNFGFFIPMYIFQTKVRHQPVVAIYQPGRVGSTAVTAAIRSANLGLTFHAHSLSPDLRKELAPPGNSISHDQEKIFSNYERVARCLRWVLHRRGPIKIVVLLRDPVGQSLSSFFYNFTTLTGHSWEEKAWAPSELRRLYWVRHALTGFEFYESWLDRELLHFTGLDIFEESFDRERGWQVYPRGNLSVLVMKIELEDPIKNAVLTSFLGLKNLQIQVENRAEDQSYAGLYHSFLEKFSLKQERLDTIYAGRFTRHFYTENEISRFKQRWSKRGS